MPRAPGFWFRDGLGARLLSPLSAIGAAMTARRVARPGWKAPVPVICVGNVTVGGAGKTTLVLDLARRLGGSGVHIILRGYGGSAVGTRLVSADDPASLVGDEALLLDEVAPTWIGADRAASAKAAVAAGAKVLLMDDGLQNPTLAKTFSFLTIDGRTGFGNGRVLPAGPLREPVEAAVKRCQAAVLIGDDATGALAQLPAEMPVYTAALVQDAAILGLAGRRVVAFAGIASPGKFFAPLAAAGADLVAARPFPDHHAFSGPELLALARAAEAEAAVLVTTPKDAVRLPPEFRAKVTVIGVGLRWENSWVIDQLLARIVSDGAG